MEPRSDCKAHVVHHYVGCIAPFKKLVGVWLTRKARDFLIYYVVRKMKGGLEIGQWELRRRRERETRYKKEGKVLNCHCNLVTASLSLLPRSAELFWNGKATD